MFVSLKYPYKRLLGHEKIDTTFRYAQEKQSNVKSALKKTFDDNGIRK